LSVESDEISELVIERDRLEGVRAPGCV